MMGLLRDFAAGALEYGLADLKVRGEDERKAKLLEMQEAAAMKRQVLLEELKAKREEQKAQKDAAMRVEADEAGRRTLQGRNFEQFKRDLGQTDATDEQLRQVFEQQYFDREVAPGDANSKRFDPKDSEFTGAARTEAMKRGASSGLINSYTAEKKELEGLERQAGQADYQNRQMLLREKQFEETQRQNQETNRLSQERLDAQIAGYGRSNQKTPAELKAMTSMDIQRSIDASRERLAIELGVEAKNLPSKLKTLQTNAARGNKDAVAQLESIQPLINQFKALTDRQMNLDRNLPGSAAASADPGSPGIVASESPAPVSGPGAARDRLQADLSALDREIALLERSKDDGMKQGRMEILQQERRKLLSRLSAPPPATENKPAATPPVSRLQEGRQTTFANGQVWTLKNGKAVQVK